MFEANALLFFYFPNLFAVVLECLYLTHEIGVCIIVIINNYYTLIPLYSFECVWQ